MGHSFSHAQPNWRDEFAALEESAPEICSLRITGAAEEAANFTFSIYRGVAVRDLGNVVKGWHIPVYCGRAMYASHIFH